MTLSVNNPTRSPQVVETISEVRDAVQRARAPGKRIGFVPTMGALHAGHVSLMTQARAECDCVAVSIFVNPTQFGPHEDFQRYPRPRDADVSLCGQAGADLVFYPTVEVMYPPGHRTYVEVAGLSDILEGAIRPGHFRGVATVVTKLLNIVQPDAAYFGQKDYQQLTLLKVMARELDLPTRIVACDTIRDADGLALSSRNAYLTPEQRQAGLALSRALRAAQILVGEGVQNVGLIQQTLQRELETTPGVTPDYAVIADPETLETLTAFAPVMVALVAARVGTTRLIDNQILRAPARG